MQTPNRADGESRHAYEAPRPSQRLVAFGPRRDRPTRTILMKLILILPIIVIATSVLLPAEVDTGRPCGGTPYDAYMGPMRQTYAPLGDGSPSINDVRSQLRTAHRFRYFFDAAQPYIRSSRGDRVAPARRL